MADSKDVLRVATKAAKVLLQSGAEIYRVQDTVLRIFNYYGMKNSHIYVLANGFFISADENTPDATAAVRNVPLQGTHLGKIIRVNHISRQICSGQITLEEADQMLEELNKPEEPRHLLFCLMSGLGAGAFCYLFDGTLFDVLLSGSLGILLQVMLFLLKNHTKYVTCLVGGFLMTAGAALYSLIFPDAHFNSVVIGAIFPMVPGVIFTTALNEFFKGDYLSGTIHLIDALMTGLCISIGVGAAILLRSVLPG